MNAMRRMPVLVIAGLATLLASEGPDLPGHGRSEGAPGPYRFDEVAVDVYALMDELSIDRFRAVGYSGGGIVLIHMATREPGRIEAMAVVSAPHVHSISTILGSPSFEDHPARVRAGPHVPGSPGA